MSWPGLVIDSPDDERFLTHQELAAERDRAVAERDRLIGDLETECQRIERMIAQLRAMGLEPPQ